MPLQRLPASVTSQALAEAVARDGAVIVETVLTPDEVAALKREMGPYVMATDQGRDDFTGRHTTRTGALVARSPLCRALVMNSTILSGARTFLDPYCETIQLHLTQLIRIMPGQPEQPLHRDRLAWGGFLPADLEPQFNTIWALTDFTRENGATQVVPGSNKWDPARVAQPEDIDYAEMAAGSVLVYSGSVIHSGGANRSDADRWGLNITYTLGWLRQEENQYLSCPPRIAAQFEPGLQALLGYAMGSYALGYFSPPTAPGEAPEVVPPEFALNPEIGAKDWGQDLYENVSARAQEGAM